MNTAAIYLYGLPGIDKPEAIKTVQYTDIKMLKAHLTKLQLGYCEDGERPHIQEHKNSKTGKKVLDCTSDVDFHYIAFIGLKLKAEANKPFESL